MEEDYKSIEQQIKIENAFQLNKEEAIRLKEKGIKEVVILDKCFLDKKDREKFHEEYFVWESDMYTYNIDTYIAILDKLYELTEDITKDMPEDERFAIIYERVCKSIEYDHAAVVENGTPEEEEYKERVIDTSRNLQNGLLEGKCVCGGYAQILKNALALCGIDCEHIGNGNHAWNKVKLHGIWFNVDATNDRFYLLYGMTPKHALKSDEDLTKTKKDVEMYGEEIKGPKCYISATKQEKKELFNIKPHVTLAKSIKMPFDIYKEIGEDIINYVVKRGKDYIYDVKSSGIRVALVNMATIMVKDFMREMEKSKEELKGGAKFIKSEIKKGKKQIIKGIKKVSQRYTKSKNKEKEQEPEPEH